MICFDSKLIIFLNIGTSFLNIIDNLILINIYIIIRIAFI